MDKDWFEKAYDLFESVRLAAAEMGSDEIDAVINEAIAEVRGASIISLQASQQSPTVKKTYKNKKNVTGNK